jgi:hypothetical protein
MEACISILMARSRIPGLKFLEEEILFPRLCENVGKLA